MDPASGQDGASILVGRCRPRAPNGNTGPVRTMPVFLNFSPGDRHGTFTSRRPAARTLSTRYDMRTLVITSTAPLPAQVE
jgi:hypothetical protein